VFLPQFRIEDPSPQWGSARRVLTELRPRPAPPHIVECSYFLIWVRKGQSCKPPFRYHHQRVPEGRGMEAESERETFAASLPFTWRHGLMGDEEVVQAAGS